MTIDFQNLLLKFLLQTKEGKKYVPMLDNSCFDLSESQVVFDLLAKYINKYKTQPGKENMIEYFDKQAKKMNLKKDVYNVIDAAIRKSYEPFNSDTGQIREEILFFAQYKKTKNLFVEYSDKIKEGNEVFKKILGEMGTIVKLAEDETGSENNKGGFLLADYTTSKAHLPKACPIFLKGINKMTAAKGFHTPQLVVFMGGPKAFKTGLILKMVIELVRDGERVYYADAENGAHSIITRAKQGMMEITREEYYSNEHDEVLTEMVGRFKALGGDLNVDFYPAYTKTLLDVDAELEYLKEQKGWTPTVIVYDSIDHFLPSNNKITEKRLQIQSVYFEAIRLNNKWGMFAITPSQVRKEAVNKAVINLKDFAEDFAKAANCHAAFAICRTEEEMELGLARIVPVVQREGVRYDGRNVCTVQIDEKRMVVNEIDYEQATATLNGMQLAGRSKKSIEDK